MASDERLIARGEWHPAGSNRSQPTELLSRTGRLVVIAAGQGDVLVSGEPGEVEFSPRVGKIARRLTFADGSLFETTDNDGIDQYLTQAGYRHVSAVHRLERFHPRLVVLVLAVILLAGLVYRYALPALVEVAVLVTPPVVPRLMSTATLETLDRTVLSDTKLSQEIRQPIIDGFADLARFSARGEAAYTLNFRAGGNIGPNAFALPDGNLILTDELVRLAKGDTEMILGILAHEIGHVELEHSLRQVYRAAGTAALVMMIAGDIGSATEDVLVQGAALVSLSYSRAAEAEADRHSVELMLKAGRDPAAIGRFFLLVEKELGDTGEASILSTHPGAPERRKAIADYETLLRNKAAQQPQEQP